jgi:hypothetical protein
MNMNKSKKIQSKMNVVREILIRNETARRNDGELIAEFWTKEEYTLCTYGSAEALLRALRLRQLSSPEEITRARRKVQELNPSLKDNQAAKERRLAEAQVRENIRYTIPKNVSRTIIRPDPRPSSQGSLFDGKEEGS